MKKIKRILAAALTATMMMAMGMTALAEETTPIANSTITINDNGNVKVKDHTFSAYQIFSGTLSEDKKTLSDIVWGDGVDGSKLLTALKNDSTIGSKFSGVNDANGVALALENATATDMVVFSRLVAENLGTAAKADVKGGIIDGLVDGYYFVKDTTTNLGDGDAASAFIVQLVGNATLNIKTDAPQIEKKLKNHEELVSNYRDANNVAIGDIVDYQITSKVPDMSNYKKYYFIVHDTLSKGLDFQNNLAIKVGNKTLADTDYTLTTTGSSNDANGTAMEIVFKNFKQYTAGDAVVITYSAKLTSSAIIGTSGNPNEVYLEYSNNPNKEGTGEDKPGTNDDVTGETPKDTVITYSTNLKIKKVDAENKALEGVKFTISGYGKNEKATYTEDFVEDTNGEYWKLNTTPATYTKIAPTTLTAGKYASETTKYNLVVKKNNESINVEYAAVQGTTDKDGLIDIGKLIADGSLPAGTYVIHEDSTLTGYNILDHDIIVNVTAEVGEKADIDFENPDKTTKVTWKVEGEGAKVYDNGMITISVINNRGAILPSTGGIGTTILYVVGGILVIGGAAAILIKRKKDAE